MPVDKKPFNAYPYTIDVVERNYESDRLTFLILMLLILVVIAWITIMLFQPLWDSSASFNWSGIVQVVLLLVVAYIVWAQNRAFHHDWPLGG